MQRSVNFVKMSADTMYEVSFITVNTSHYWTIVQVYSILFMRVQYNSYKTSV